MIRGVSTPRFWPFFAHFPPSLARSLRLDARKPDSAKRRRNNGGKGAKSGVETAVYDPSMGVYFSLGWSEAGWPPQDGGQADLSDSSESSESSEPDGLDFHGMGGDDY